MTNDEAREAASRITQRLGYLYNSPHCQHTWDALNYCLWCHYSRLNLDAFALARHHLELTSEDKK